MSEKITFTYHPDPELTGAFHRGEAVCDCCEKKTELYYLDPFYAAEDALVFCPACIKSGEAARKFDGCFTAPDYCDPVDDPLKTAEICFRTPGYNGIQQEQWMAPCGDYCEYWGEIGYNDLTDQLRADFEETWYDRNERWDLDTVCGSLGMQYDGYLFKCRHCGKFLLYAQRD